VRPVLPLLYRPSNSINFYFFFSLFATTTIYTLSLHDALPISNFSNVGMSVNDVVRGVLGNSAPQISDGATIGGGETDSRGNLRRSEEHTSELQSRFDLVCRRLLEKKNICTINYN